MVMVTVMVMAKRMRPEAVEEVGKIIGLTARKLADCERPTVMAQFIQEVRIP